MVTILLIVSLLVNCLTFLTHESIFAGVMESSPFTEDSPDIGTCAPYPSDILSCLVNVKTVNELHMLCTSSKFDELSSLFKSSGPSKYDTATLEKLKHLSELLKSSSVETETLLRILNERKQKGDNTKLSAKTIQSSSAFNIYVDRSL
jgi:hypothetical protein